MTGWLVPDRPKPAATGRLIVFPHAGGTASAFRAWPALAGAHLDVVRVQYPGREGRFREPARDRIDALADPVATELGSTGDVRPCALFGHSMGALVALEVAHRLTAAGAAPGLLVVSAALPPHRLGRQPGFSRMPVRELVAVLSSVAGSGAGLLADTEVADTFLPTIRADLAAVESYRYLAGQPRLACPIIAMSGTEDALVQPHQVAGWAELTAGGFRARRFPGGHFYLWAAAEAVIAEIQEAVAGE